ncbi:hypothetical protein BaRGS_00017295 [Batillaria attramentaria]|uniref:RCC1-like domain-containing protein n=1 Tax=Batillaria attramentaria TaxID=370345 RepID=A0ABD0KWR0_9CAEN
MATAPQPSPTFSEAIDSSTLLSWVILRTFSQLMSLSAVLCVGANSHGQLGQAHTQDQLVPQNATLTTTVLLQLTGGGGHSIALTRDGSLHTCGSNSCGQLGTGGKDDVHVFSLVQFPTPVSVREVTAGWDFSLAVTENGALYSWGNNTFYQLGRQTSDKISPHPGLVQTELTTGVRMVAVAAGLRHALALSEDGSVYGWGQNKRGQVGLAASRDGKQEAKIPRPDLPVGVRPVQIAAGANHSGFLTDSGSVYMWGCNRFGQTSQDPSQTTQLTDPCCIPASVFSGVQVRHIACGWTHNLAVSALDQVYSWGRADYGQLGRSCDQSCDPTPKVVERLGKVHAVACGSEHNLAVTDDGNLYSWGWNEHGMCGTGNESNVPLPVQVSVQAEHYKSVYIGPGSCGDLESVEKCFFEVSPQLLAVRMVRGIRCGHTLEVFTPSFFEWSAEKVLPEQVEIHWNMGKRKSTQFSGEKSKAHATE